MKIILLIIAFVVSTEIVHAKGDNFVSLIQLIATPKVYDGMKVTVAGFMRLEFEGTAIYLHREDYENSLYQNGLWLHIGESDDIRDLDKTYVLIEGIFDASDHGHMDLWAGSIKEIDRIIPWGKQLNKEQDR